MHILPKLPDGISAMKHLLIVGNGFDVAHGIHSRYKHFKEWLEENDCELIEHMSLYFPRVFDNDLEWWNDFENNLDMIDAHDEIARVVSENYPDFSSDEFRDRDYHAAGFSMENEMSQLYQDIQNAFESWIKSLTPPQSQIFDLSGFDMFLTFNYTATLQQTYRISDDNVLHIHGKSGLGEVLIVGHNANPEHYEKGINEDSPEPPANLDLEDLERWYEEHVDDYMTSETRQVAEKVVISFKKPTDEIISKYRIFFGRCYQLEEISFYGFSFAQVDMPYVIELANNTSENAIWKIYYYSENDYNTAMFVKELLKGFKFKIEIFSTEDFPTLQPRIQRIIS